MKDLDHFRENLDVVTKKEVIKLFGVFMDGKFDNNGFHRAENIWKYPLKKRSSHF